MRVLEKRQYGFAHLSGDYNPLHVDKNYCRKTPYESLVVHGIHQILLGVESFSRDLRLFSDLDDHKNDVNLTVTFREVLRVGEDISFRLVQMGLERLEFEIIGMNNGSVKTSVCFEVIEKSKELYLEGAVENENHVEPVLYFSARSAATLGLEGAFSCLGSRRMSLLLTLTRVVGMHCPGDCALFSSFFLKLDQNVRFIEVSRKSYDSRFKLAKYDIHRLGSYAVFLRPPVVNYLNFEMPSPPDTSLFNDMHIGIFGAGRGIGYAAAQAFLQNNLRVTIFVRDMRADTVKKLEKYKKCGSQYFDVESPDYAVLDCKKIDAMFYFCTPSSRLGSREGFNTALFERYCMFYNTVPQVLLERLKPKLFIQPSSVAVEHAPKDMKEYTQAKILQENWMRKESRNPAMLCFRLPAVKTDQNTIAGKIMCLSLADAVASIINSASQKIESINLSV